MESMEAPPRYYRNLDTMIWDNKPPNLFREQLLPHRLIPTISEDGSPPWEAIPLRSISNISFTIQGPLPINGTETFQESIGAGKMES
jgi:hypothetical protein